MSLLCWLSPGLYDVLTLATTDSSTTLLPPLLVDDSTVGSTLTDSAVAWLWVWLTQLMGSWLSSTLKQSAWLCCAALQLLSTNSARICYSCDSSRVAESDSPSYNPDSLHQLIKGLLSCCSRISFLQLSKGLLSRSYYDSADSAESNSLMICTQQGDSVLGWLSLLHKLSKDLLSLLWILI